MERKSLAEHSGFERDICQLHDKAKIDAEKLYLAILFQSRSRIRLIW